FTIPKELRNWFRQDRTRLNLLFVAARNTICILVNRSLLKKLKTKQLRNTHYIFKDIPIRNEFGMIATIHTFGRDLKWNPHIHCLIPELIYSFKKGKIKTFHHFNFIKLIRNLKKRTDSIKIILKDSMSTPNSNPLTTLLTMLHLIKIVKIFKAA
ncbi:transposase, partial [Holdemanella porci]|uniref:transposase n=1 Tax=Holdemanella porci TaxID=2652276 RepID=UPI0022E76D5F